MHKLRKVLKRLFTPVTILFVPHNSGKPYSLKLPSIGLAGAVILVLAGVSYFTSMAVNELQYREMRDALNYYSGQFLEMRTTMDALRKSEQEFHTLFKLKDKDEVLQEYQPADSGSVDIELLKKEIRKSMESVKDIRSYLSRQKSVYIATPRGWPAKGYISSGFGVRTHPIYGTEEFHSGVDIPVDKGTGVRATADGVVSFAGPSGKSGNLVVIEHGLGYSTVYAHNEVVDVHAGQLVKRGDVIANAGSTGLSTGPHVHYEVWKNGKPVNPVPFLEGRL